MKDYAEIQKVLGPTSKEEEALRLFMARESTRVHREQWIADSTITPEQSLAFVKERLVTEVNAFLSGSDKPLEMRLFLLESADITVKAWAVAALINEKEQFFLNEVFKDE